MSLTQLSNRALGLLDDAFNTMSLGIANPTRSAGDYSAREYKRFELSKSVGEALSAQLPASLGEEWFEFTPRYSERPFFVKALDCFRDIDVMIADIGQCCWSCKIIVSPDSSPKINSFIEKFNRQLGMEIFAFSVSESGLFLTARVDPYVVPSFKRHLQSNGQTLRKLLSDLKGNVPIVNLLIEGDEISGAV